MDQFEISRIDENKESFPFARVSSLEDARSLIAWIKVLGASDFVIEHHVVTENPDFQQAKESQEARLSEFAKEHNFESLQQLQDTVKDLMMDFCMLDWLKNTCRETR